MVSTIVYEVEAIGVGYSIESYGYGVQTNNNSESLPLFLD